MKMRLRTVVCPMCGSDDEDEVFSEHLVNVEESFHYLTETPCHFRIVKCKSCSMVYSNPVFDEETILALYASCSAENLTCESKRRSITINMERYFKRLMKVSGIHKGRFLDIGSGDGILMGIAEKAGFEVYGVEPSKEACGHSAKILPNAKILNSAYKEDLFPENFFDLIGFVHVIDHVYNPGETLRWISRHLRPGGHVFIATHDISSLLAKCMRKNFIAWSIQHLSYYTPPLLSDMVERNHLKPIKSMKSLTTYTFDHLVENGIRNTSLRNATLWFLKACRLGHVQFTFPFGNIELIAKK